MKIYIPGRSLQLLLILEKEHSWISSKELSSLLEVSNKTIQKDIHTINNFLPKNWSIEISHGLGYKLNLPSYETVQFKFGNDDSKTKADILSLIVNNEVKNLNELGEKLFLSVSSTHKLVKNIDIEITEKYNLRISDRSLHILGEENAIRRLIFDMQFLKNNEHYYDDFFLGHKMELNNFLIHNTRIVPSIHGLNIFYLFLDITINRIKYGFNSESIPNDILRTSTQSNLYLKIEPIFNYIESLYSVKLSLNERFTLYYAFLNTEFHLIETYEPTFFKKLEKDHEIFNHFVDHLSDIFNLDLRSSNTFMINAFNMYYTERHIINIPKLTLYKDFGSTKNKIDNQHPLINEFKTICNNWSKKNAVWISKQTASSLLHLIQDFKVSTTKVNVLLIKSNTFILNDTLLTKLKRELGAKVNFSIFYPSDKNNLDYLLSSFDFVLSDVSIPESLLSKPHIFLGESVNEQILNKIHQEINEVLYEKDKLTFQ